MKTYFDPITQEHFTDSLNVNAVGPYWLTFAFLPLLEKWKNSEGGKKFVPQVIMTSSMNAWTKVRFLDIDGIEIRAILTSSYDERVGSGNKWVFVPVHVLQVCDSTCDVDAGA